VFLRGYRKEWRLERMTASCSATWRGGCVIIDTTHLRKKWVFAEKAMCCCAARCILRCACCLTVWCRSSSVLPCVACRAASFVYVNLYFSYIQPRGTLRALLFIITSFTFQMASFYSSNDCTHDPSVSLWLQNLMILAACSKFASLVEDRKHCEIVYGAF